MYLHHANAKGSLKQNTPDTCLPDTPNALDKPETACTK